MTLAITFEEAPVGSKWIWLGTIPTTAYYTVGQTYEVVSHGDLAGTPELRLTDNHGTKTNSGKGHIWYLHDFRKFFVSAEKAPLTFGYTNYRGEYAVREAIPLRIEYRTSEWHGDQPQWIMVAWDVEKQAERDFLMRDMQPAREVNAATFSEEAIKHMVDRFLMWKIPADFAPDGGVKFDPHRDPDGGFHRPIGTNLLTATQAKAMVLHMLEGLPAPAARHNFRIDTPSPEKSEAEPMPGEDSAVAHGQSTEPAYMKVFEERSRNATPERVQELLEANTRYLEDGRALRRTLGAAALLSQTWRANGNELSADILANVLLGEIDPQSDMVKHSAPGAGRCVGPIEEGLRTIRSIAWVTPKHPACEPILALVDSLLEHNFAPAKPPVSESKAEPSPAYEYRDQREDGEFGDGMTV